MQSIIQRKFVQNTTNLTLRYTHIVSSTFFPHGSKHTWVLIKNIAKTFLNYEIQKLYFLELHVLLNFKHFKGEQAYLYFCLV